MTISQYLADLEIIRKSLHQKYPLPDQEKRTFAYITKVVEELGELSEVTLAKSGLQRDVKKFKDVQQNIEEEFADTVNALFLLGCELDIDIEKALERKLLEIKQRFQLTDK